jgi:tellurite resistance protein TerC
MQAWLVLAVIAAALLALDLVSLRRHHGETSIRTAARQSAMWLGTGLLFGVYVYYHIGRAGALEYYTGFLIEKSLSVDNLFVFLAIFRYFAVDRKYQSELLFYGIVGAIIFRAIFIFGGSYLLSRLDWMVYVFGLILIVTAIRLATRKEEEVHPEKNIIVRAARRVFPVTTRTEGGQLFIRADGRVLATPLFLALLTIESTDILFAVDSVPAILAITRNTFIVYSSNLFAILGLRALYFFLAEIVERFTYLSYAISVILLWVGIKMIAHQFLHIPTQVSLLVVAVSLLCGIIASMLFKSADREAEETTQPDHEVAGASD